MLEIIACVRPRDSLFGGTYRAYQVLNLGDFITLVLAIGGTAFLVWLLLGLLRGRLRSGLAGNLIERPSPRSG